ncbi:MAG TPA: M48 family metalloprotease [Thermoanaerobaculia bacterium]|nr:M48 family metalloprotease [Thermoanaerobaculia bacterium]
MLRRPPLRGRRLRHAALAAALAAAVAVAPLAPGFAAAQDQEPPSPPVTAPASPAPVPAGEIRLTVPAAATPPAGSFLRPGIKNPELFEKSLEVARRALDQYGLLDDPQEARRVADIGYRVARESGFTGYPFTFHVIDMPEPNAFALPGGHLFITRGMLDLGLDDDMLAALLGHEIAHVVLDHHTKMQRRATLMNVLGQALVVGVMLADDGGKRVEPHPMDRYDPEYRNRHGERIQGAAAVSLVVSELLLRGFSREHEDQSDAEGQRWAAAAGFDPEGANRLFDLMRARIPQSKRYGYWRTHPFFDERVRSGKVRAELLKVAAPRPADDYRLATQATLLTWLDGVEVVPEDGFYDETGRMAAKTGWLVEAQALTAWPRGAAAERLRLARLHRLRDPELARPSIERDYGALDRAYAAEIQEVAELSPGSPFLEVLARERRALSARAEDLYPKAVQVLAGGVFETPFLERFLSSWPDAPQVPQAALLLGDAYSRLGRHAEAVQQYLKAMETGPGSPEAERASRGLAVLAPRLHSLAALERLAQQRIEPSVASLAGERLEQKAASFTDVDNGAEYLDRFPDGRHAVAVGERMNQLADGLYAEVVLYQAIGDQGKAVERINLILTYAPLSPAADLLRDRALLEAT